jgi:hypothetical protein
VRSLRGGIAGAAQRVAHFAALVAGSIGLAACPGGAELDNPERFFWYASSGNANAGTGSGATGAGSGGTGTGGTTPSAGKGGTGTGGAAPIAGSTGAPSVGGSPGGTAGAGAPASCDVVEALGLHCSLSSCHNASSKIAGLDLSDPASLKGLIGRPAGHQDMNCDLSGENFVPCTPDETAARCPTGLLLLDSAAPTNSWLVRKLTVGAADNCGDDMPVSPGNSVTKGWSDERRACLIQYFTALAASP